MAEEFADRDPNDIADAIATYEANVSRLDGPGSLVMFLRTGAWPVDGILSPREAAAAEEREAVKRQAIEDRRIRGMRETECFELVRTLRRRGDTENSIRAELARRGLLDVYEERP